MESMYKEASQELKDMMELMVNDKQVFRLKARIIRAYYDELISVGFDAKEALQIVLSDKEEMFIINK